MRTAKAAELCVLFGWGAGRGVGNCFGLFWSKQVRQNRKLPFCHLWARYLRPTVLQAKFLNVAGAAGSAATP